jgi:low affinity Fe/Cu permease
MFRKFARRTADVLGSSVAFMTAVTVVLVWAGTGPIFHFSDTWQLVINTGTTVVTFLMVFLIQNTQNRDAVALHLKLDELLRSVHEARTGLVALEDLSDEDLARLKDQFAAMSKKSDRDATSVKIERPPPGEGPFGSDAAVCTSG